MGDAEELVTLFKGLGMSDAKAAETVKNKSLSSHLKKCIDVNHKITGKQVPEDVKISKLIIFLASKAKQSTEKFIPFIMDHIIKGNIDLEVRLSAALKYLLDHITDDIVNEKEFEVACGIGVKVAVEDIETAVKNSVNFYKDELENQRYRFNTGRLMEHVRGQPKMSWADGGLIKAEVDLQQKVLLGPKTLDDLKPAEQAKSSNKGKDKPVKPTSVPSNTKTNLVKEKSASGDSADVTTAEHVDSFEKIANLLKNLPLHKPGENYTMDGYPSSQLALKLLDQHASRTKRQVRTRFPPEPNGILHIGHAKAININFGYAKVNNGICFLRYDDTNPEKEEERFFKSILEMVEWLGYKPYKVTHASDYFEELYQWAVVLIKKGLAYVCHQKADELKGFNPPPSPWRERSIEENYQLFQDMKSGKFDEGAATLRMKITLEEGKQDPVAYRVRYVPHPKSGDNWCIYPTYDFTHCLCDSVEDISHSLCTKEFQNRRSSYYWLCEAVETYIPVQWEYGRLNVSYTVVSKRKIAKLIEEKIVNDWDDPRLFTLPALRRRGFPADAINEFCIRMGVTGAQITVDPAMIEACVRDVLNNNAPRTMVVIDPIRVVIENFPADHTKVLSVPDFPAAPDSACHSIAFESVIYIDRDDFKEKSDKGYKRFAMDQPVGLRHAGVVLTCTNIVKDNSGATVELKATCQDIAGATKPKGFIHWVSKPINVQVRQYERLFNHKNPEDKAEVPAGFLSDCNPNSLKIDKALADAHVIAAKPFTQYQFERIGYFSVDPDTSSTGIVFNKTVSLKEDTGKN